MVLRPLENIAKQFVFKKRNRQLHQLYQVIRNKGDVYPSRDVAQNLISQYVENHHAQLDTDIANQHHIDKFHVRSLNAHVNYRFGYKRQHPL